MSDITMEEFEQRATAFLQQQQQPEPEPTPVEPEPLDPLTVYFLKTVTILRKEAVKTGKWRAEARTVAKVLDAAGVDWGKDWQKLRSIGTDVLKLKELQSFPTWWVLPSRLPEIVDGVLVFPEKEVLS